MPDYLEAVSSIKCPVLAIFGEKDNIVNRRNTIQFYKKTIGVNKRAELTIKTFPNCNHNIQKCNTGAFRKDLSQFDYEFCDGYYETIKNWIINNGFGK